VPLSNINEFTALVGQRRTDHHSLGWQEKTAELSAERAADQWLKYAPTYTLSNVKLIQLMQRPKNCEKDISKANTVILEMQDTEADACSTKFMDNSGKTLVCVFSHRALATGPECWKKGVAGREDRGGKVSQVIWGFFDAKKV
jgi:hypothetical protein